MGVLLWRVINLVLLRMIEKMNSNKCLLIKPFPVQNQQIDVLIVPVAVKV